MLGVGDVARNDDERVACRLETELLESVLVAAIDNHGPAKVEQGLRQRSAKPPRSAGDDCNLHLPHLRFRLNIKQVNSVFIVETDDHL